MHSYAKNKIKLQRAIAAAGANATEQDIYDEYVRIGGAVEEGYRVATPFAEESAGETVETPAPKPKRAYRKKA